MLVSEVIQHLVLIKPYISISAVLLKTYKEAVHDLAMIFFTSHAMWLLWQCSPTFTWIEVRRKKQGFQFRDSSAPLWSRNPFWKSLFLSNIKSI